MPVPSTAPLVSRLIPGGLEKFLREARDRKESYLTISDRLLAEHDITVSPQTVTNWCALYGVVAGEKGSTTEPEGYDPDAFDREILSDRRKTRPPDASTKGLPKKCVT